MMMMMTTTSAKGKKKKKKDTKMTRIAPAMKVGLSAVGVSSLRKTPCTLWSIFHNLKILRSLRRLPPPSLTHTFPCINDFRDIRLNNKVFFHSFQAERTKFEGLVLLPALFFFLLYHNVIKRLLF